MIYDNNTHVHSVSDVKQFFHHVVFDRQADFHPDDDFASYLSPQKEPLFTADEAAVYNRLLEECFTVCDEKDEDIYDLGWAELEKFLLDK